MLILINHYSSDTYASSKLFCYNKHAVADALKAVSAVEDYAEVQDLTYTEIHEAKPDLLQQAHLSDETNSIGNSTALPIGIPSFLWGCCLGFIGVIVVCVTTDMNEKEAGKVIAGCLLNAVFLSGLFLLYQIINAIGDSCGGFGGGFC